MPITPYTAEASISAPKAGRVALDRAARFLLEIYDT